MNSHAPSLLPSFPSLAVDTANNGKLDGTRVTRLVISDVAYELSCAHIDTCHRQHGLHPNCKGGSAGIRSLYLYITSSGDIHYDNWSYAVVVPSCACANDLSFKICVYQVVKSSHSCCKTGPILKPLKLLRFKRP